MISKKKKKKGSADRTRFATAIYLAKSFQHHTSCQALFSLAQNPFYPASLRGKIRSLHTMVPRARKNTTLDPSANPFQALGEASPDTLSVAGGPRPSVVVESWAPTPSLFGASPSPFLGGGIGPIPLVANPPTAKCPRSDTTYLPGFTNETDPKSYWVQRFAAAAAAQENPNMV